MRQGLGTEGLGTRKKTSSAGMLIREHSAKTDHRALISVRLEWLAFSGP
jgi:hypothetical protein